MEQSTVDGDVQPCLEYCLSNVTADARARIDDAPVDARALNCLEHCGHCYRRPFLVVDGEFVAGASHQRLLADAVDVDVANAAARVDR